MKTKIDDGEYLTEEEFFGYNREKVREVLNKWLKQQTKYMNYKGSFQGYMITKNQVEKLKKLLWRL